MPFPNEHSCRLEQPGKFKDKSFRRISRLSKTVKKVYAVIRGIFKKDNKWGDQAYRYKRKRWTVQEARNHCRRHKGQFEAATGKD